MAAEGARTLPASSPATSRDSVEAPWWHLPLLVSFVVVVSATGLLLGPGATPQSPRFRILSAYVPMLLVAWGFVGYVALASPSESLVSRWVGNRDRGRLAADVALGFASMAGLLAAESIFRPHLDATRAAALAAILPHSLAEHVVWVVVAASVGFSEELVYRGYLLSRFSLLSGVPAVGIAAQAALFGVAHAEQGAAAACRIAAYGVLLGIVAVWRKSLRPVVVCHVLLDVLSGFAA